MITRALTHEQKRARDTLVWSAISRAWLVGARMPTIGELSDLIGCRPGSPAFDSLNRLERLGYIRRPIKNRRLAIAVLVPLIIEPAEKAEKVED